MMPNWILCNSCFHPPSEDLRLAVTTCGHIVCQKCFQKGKQGECLICKSQCQVSPLSDKSRPEVQDLFSDINIVANRYLSETTKVLIFQMRHQRRLLSHYRERNIKLEEVLNQMKQEMVQMRREMEVQSAHTVQLVTPRKQQSVRAAQQCSRVSPSSVAPLKQILFASPMALSQQASTSSLVDQMDVDGQGLYRKPEVYGSRSRISLISPPQAGRMGSVLHRPISHTPPVTPFPRSATVSRECERSSYTQGAPMSAPISLSYRRELAPGLARETPPFSQPSPFYHSTLPTLGLQGRLPK